MSAALGGTSARVFMGISTAGVLTGLPTIRVNGFLYYLSLRKNRVMENTFSSTIYTI